MKVKDWFHKENLNADFSEIRDYILPLLKNGKWHNCHPSQAPGSKWTLLEPDDWIKEKLEQATKMKVYPDFYVWHYENIKDLKPHRDTNDPGSFRQIAGVVPLVGKFEVQVFDENNLSTPIDSCIYEPGEFLILNNTKYFHGGSVLSETRISLHFYFDFYNKQNLPLNKLLEIHRN